MDRHESGDAGSGDAARDAASRAKTSGRRGHLYLVSAAPTAPDADTTADAHPRAQPSHGGGPPLDLSPLSRLANELLGQTCGVGDRICQTVECVTQSRVRLLLVSQTAERTRAFTAQADSGAPVRFGGREYGVMHTVSDHVASGLPPIPASELARLARICAMVLHLLEQAALIEGLMRHLPLAPTEPLTPREREVLRLMARGEHPQRIAGRLHISPETVGKHQEHIYAKLQVHCFVDAVLVAHRAGITHYLTGPAAGPVPRTSGR